MNLLELEIDGFGVWTGLRLENLSARITAFYGPNEAGKTTLLQFIRTILYGFSPERRRYLPPVHGGRAGGWLQIGTSLGKFTVSRHAIHSPRNPHGEELRVLDAAGAPQHGQLLDRLLGRVDEATFNNVFAFGLREIQELGALSDTAAAELLYGLSTGLDRVSLVDVLRELRVSRERLLSTDGKPCQIIKLLAEREQLLGEIDELRALSHRYAALVHQNGELDADVKRHDEERARLEQDTRAVEAAISVREAWGRRADLDLRIARLEEHPAISPILADQIDSISRRIEQRRSKLDAFKQERLAVRKQAAALGVNRALARCAPRIEALQEQEAWIGSLESQAEHFAAEVAAIEAQLAEQQRHLGGDKDRHSAAPRIEEHTRVALRPLARALRGPQTALKESRRQIETSLQTVEELASFIREALADRKEKELAPALERAGALVANLRRRVQLDERLTQMNAQDADLAEQSQQLEERQLLPAGLLWLHGGAFLLGFVLVGWGGVSWLAGASERGGEVSLFGLVFCAATVFSKYMLERSKVEQLEAAQSQATSLVVQIKQAKEERAALDAQLPPGAGPWLMRLQTAEKELAALEELMSIDAERQAAQREVDAASGRMEEAEREIKVARRRWQNALAAAGLPKDLSPKQVRHLSERHVEGHALQRRLRHARLEHDERRKEFDAVAGRVEQALADVGLTPASPKASERLKQLRQALDEYQEIAARRDALDQRLRRIHRRQTRLAHGIDRWQHRLQVAFAQAGLSDEGEYRQRIEDGELLESLRGQHAAATREIAAALGVRLTEEDVRDWLESSSAGQLEARWEELSEQLQTAVQRLQTLFEERGRVQHELKALADDRRLAERFVDLGVVEQRLRDAVEQWQVVAVTGLVLDEVRKLYEAERQPETLQEASLYLKRLTEGRYTRVWTPLGENQLRVDDAEGRPLPVESLSRGTREQLFLALRLALVGCYARRGIELPLVLDDVLVNFDARRAKAAAAVLRDFASGGRQLLVFTCHEHVWKLFKNLKLPARLLPANDDAETATLAYQPPELETFDEDEPEDAPLEPAATWRPDWDGAAAIQVEEDDAEEDDADEGTFSWDEAEEEFEDDQEEEEIEEEADELEDEWEEEEELVEEELDEGEWEEEEVEDEDEAEADFDDEYDDSDEDSEPEPSKPQEPLPQVKVVRRGGPFDNALWFEPVEDDLDDEDFAGPREGRQTGRGSRNREEHDDEDDEASARHGMIVDEDDWQADEEDSDDDVEAA